MEEVVEGMEYQKIQQFVADAPWSARAVIDDVACRGNRILGGEQNTYLIIDESSFEKKGTKSVTARTKSVVAMHA